jgi:nucleoside-diphosphate-sugar epimerase
MILAITGGTGFVGRHLIDRALAAGHQVRALTRRPQPPRDGVTWITGDLATPGSLAQGADAVVHVAGIVNAPDRAGFVAGNVDGTRTILAAATEASIERFVHVSSLSAREPQLSDYGWSKREAERLVEASALAWTIVRPTAIYGPGDMEMRDLFRAAKLGLAFLPPPGLMSAVEVSDLARLLLILAQRPDGGDTYEVDDGRAWTHVEFARALGAAVGRPVLPLHLPKPLMRVSARLDRLIRGDKAKLTRDRVGYLCHPDWSATPDRRPPASLWAPLIDTPAGLAATARWYRAHALL